MSLKTNLNDVVGINQLYNLVKDMNTYIGVWGGRRIKASGKKGSVTLNDIVLKFQDLSKSISSNTDNHSEEIFGIFDKIDQLDVNDPSGLRGILTKIKRQFGKLFRYRGFNRKAALNTLILNFGQPKDRAMCETKLILKDFNDKEANALKRIIIKSLLEYEIPPFAEEFNQFITKKHKHQMQRTIAFLKIANVLYKNFLKDESKSNDLITDAINKIIVAVGRYGKHGDHNNIFHQDYGKDIVDKACTGDFKAYLIKKFFKDNDYHFNETFFEKNNYHTWVETQVPSAEERGQHMKDFFEIYDSNFRPNLNMTELKKYVMSKDFACHAQSAKIYYNKGQLDIKNAVNIMNRREPVNMMMNQLYDEEKLKEKYGYTCSVYNDPEAKKQSGESFRDKPNTVCVYSETYLWPTPGDDKVKHEIACLSVPAPLLWILRNNHIMPTTLTKHLVAWP